MYVVSYVQSALQIIELYGGEVPFAVWLKQYFKNHKKYGSRDRKYIAHLCYCYFRLGHSFRALDKKQRLTISVFLSSTAPNDLLAQLALQWNDAAEKDTEEKLQLLQAEKELYNLFPWHTALTHEIDTKAFLHSFLVQPDLFLRLRPGKEKRVIEKLQQALIPFHQLLPDCVALPNSTKAETLIQIDEEAVIQDLSSQQTLNALFTCLPQQPQTIAVWDCCAASGGKSLLLHDRLPESRLTVSDIRESILINLKKRFQRAGIIHYQSFIADLAKEKAPLPESFDVIICDAPCTGSGTWSRTPEQLYFFDKQRIHQYADKQQRIAWNVVKNLKPNGFFIYITCSVFKQENEDVVQFIQKDSSLTLKNMQYIKGYSKKADTLFTALFQKITGKEL